MNQRYKTLDPFKGTHNLIRCEDISNVSFKDHFFIKYAFDCIFDREEFLKGTYKLYEFNDPAMRSLKREVDLVPVYFKNNIYPSVNEVMLNEEDCEKSFLMISNSYSAGYYILYINVNVIGSSIFSSKTINILNSDDLIGKISFRHKTGDSYTHKITNGQVYNPELYPDFYKKFGTRWGGTSTAPKLPNLIGSFPRNIGTSSNPYSSYFNVNDPGNVYVQRIPKIKWMNHLIGNHTHTVYYVWWDTWCNTSINGGGGCSPHCNRRTESTQSKNFLVSLKDNNWNNIQTGTNVNLNNYDFTNRFEPKCIEVIPFIRMI